MSTEEDILMNADVQLTSLDSEIISIKRDLKGTFTYYHCVQFVEGNPMIP